MAAAAAGGELPCYTIIAPLTDSDLPTEQLFRKEFENPSDDVKRNALKKLIVMMLNGDKFNLLMTIIRFVMPSKDHMIKKLLLLYWELVPKTNAEGKLLHEMILVCDAYRKDLQHPNEFIRGSTLRFLCKLRHAELLEPVMPAIRACLDHRHSYVRRNAVLAIFTIYKHADFLIPDAPELIQSFLAAEQDPSCKRNAFMMLLHVDQERALEFLFSCVDQLQSFSDIMQLVIVELIYKVCRANPQERGRFIRIVFNLLQSTSAAVRYEAAKTLTAISQAPTAIKAAAQAYIELIIKEGDNNVKLIVLDRLIELKGPAHERIMQDILMDVMRVLTASDLEVRKKTLDFVLGLVTSRNVEEVVSVLKKEISKTHSGDDYDKVGEYRELLVRALHTCGVKFPDVASDVVPLLMDFLGESGAGSAVSVVLFVREVMERFPEMRRSVLEKLLENFSQMKDADVLRAALWICGEYAETEDLIRQVITTINASLGALPIVDSELKAAAGDEEEATAAAAQSQSNISAPANKISADGTYITQSALTSRVTVTHGVRKSERPPVRTLLMEGDFFVGSVVGTTLTKLAIRLRTLVSNASIVNSVTADALLSISSIMHLGESGLPSVAIDEDSLHRLRVCVATLTNFSDQGPQIFNEACRDAFSQMITAQHGADDSKDQSGAKVRVIEVHPDDCLSIRQLAKRDEANVDEFEESLTRATGAGRTEKEDQTTLSKVFQLTGFSDPVYAEAYVNVNQYDIILDVLIVNQTNDTLQGLTLELATLGDLKLAERPQSLTVGPHDFCNIKTTVKVSSIETGIIFGNIVYDIAGAASDRNLVVLNDIHIDIMDYIQPAHCTDSEFRAMWQEFEWENKVILETTTKSLSDFLQHLLKSTNMACLTPDSMLAGECEFLAANLYAKSIFGEDALANVCLERLPEGKVKGHMRIRSKTQGIALSIGDKVALKRAEK